MGYHIFLTMVLRARRSAIILRRAKHEDLQSAPNVTACSLQTHSLKSVRKTPAPFRYPELGQSIVYFVRGLKRFAGTCEFTNEHLSDSLRDRFICRLRSEQIKGKLCTINTHTGVYSLVTALRLLNNKINKGNKH